MRAIYDELLANGLSAMDRYYNRHMHSYGVPQHDARWVLLGGFVLFTALKYAYAWYRHRMFIQYAAADPRYRKFCKEAGLDPARGEGLLMVGAMPPTWHDFLPIQVGLTLWALYVRLRRGPGTPAEQKQALAARLHMTEAELDDEMRRSRNRYEARRTRLGGTHGH
jgi:hypothetical protein